MAGIKSDSWIKKMATEKKMIEPFNENLLSEGVISYGLSSYGYDFRLSEEFLVPVFKKKVFDPKEGVNRFRKKVSKRIIIKPFTYILGRSIEYFRIPRNVLGICVGKSTYARSGILINITPLEPEWEGNITIAISNLSQRSVILYPGEGIGQVLFFEADEVCSVSYADRKGKYLYQKGLVPPLVKP